MARAISEHTSLMHASPIEKIDPPLPSWTATLGGPRSKSTSFWHLLVFALAIGIAMNVLLPSWTAIFVDTVTLGNIAGLTALFSALAAAILLHEGGHLVAALLMRFEILGASLGPLRVTRVHGKWTLHLAGGTFFSGSVSAIPRSNESWRMRMLVVVAGGPAATFLTGALALFMLLLSHQGTWLNSFLSALAQFSFFLFVLGLIPNGREAKVRNDARLFASLFRNTADAQEIMLYHMVTQLSLAGIRPRDYPERLIRNIASQQSRPDSGSLYAYTIVLWAIDRGDWATAAAWNRRMLELGDSCDVRLRNLTLARSACFHVLSDDDLTEARDQFNDVTFEMLSPACFMHRARAAQSLTVGNTLATLSEVCSAAYNFPKHLPYYEFERMLLCRIHKKALAVSAKPRPVCRIRNAA